MGKSVANSAHRKSRFEKSAAHWSKALSINPFNSKGFFTLGHCYLKMLNIESAAEAYRKCCQLEPSHGEAWNNLGASLLHLNKKLEAFTVFAEAVHSTQRSWIVDENYAKCAAIVGYWTHAIRGLSKVIKSTCGKYYDPEILELIFSQMADLKFFSKHANFFI